MEYTPHLDWIDTQYPRMCRQVSEWANVNSSTDNLLGLAHMTALLRDAFSVLGGVVTEIRLTPGTAIDAYGQLIPVGVGSALSIIKRPKAPIRVFLGIHMDTVYPAGSAFQTTTAIDSNTLRGPGVADAKGGLCVMLTALQVLERSPCASQIGWEVLINPDEEIGSIASAPLLAEAAHRNHLGLLFEPALANGEIVDQRKGSGNFAVVIRGRSAHAGRDFALGRNAVVAMAELTAKLHALNAAHPRITVNISRIEGGSPANVVPDLAVGRINVRTTVPEDAPFFIAHLDRFISELNQRDGFHAEWHGGFTSPPKLLDEPTRILLRELNVCGRDLGIAMNSRPSGGACDGNKLAAAGLPNIDSLGVRGGNIHSPEEFILLDSLAERAKITALFLMKLAAGAIVWPPA